MMFPAIIAHRGVRSEIPENTLASIKRALSLPGLTGVEFDVELARANRPVVLHQETLVPSPDLRRLVPATRDHTSRDWVSQHHVNEITSLDAGSWLGPQFADLRVPKLDDVLGLEWGDRTAYVELKDPTYWGQRDLARPAQIVDAVIAELLQFTGKLNVLSFNPEIISEVHRRAPKIALTFALWTEWQSRQEEAISVAKRSGATSIFLADTMLFKQPEWVDSARGEGLGIGIYPVSPARGEPEFANWTAASQSENWIKILGLGIDALATDFPRETVEFFRRRVQ